MAETSSTSRLEARVPTEVHALLKRAAEIQGRTMTDFLVAAASEEANRVIMQHEIVRLSLSPNPTALQRNRNASQKETQTVRRSAGTPHDEIEGLLAAQLFEVVAVARDHQRTDGASR